MPLVDEATGIVASSSVGTERGARIPRGHETKWTIHSTHHPATRDQQGGGSESCGVGTRCG